MCWVNFFVVSMNISLFLYEYSMVDWAITVIRCKIELLQSFPAHVAAQPKTSIFLSRFLILPSLLHHLSLQSLLTIPLFPIHQQTSSCLVLLIRLQPIFFLCFFLSFLLHNLLSYSLLLFPFIEQFLFILIPKQIVDFGLQDAEIVLDSFDYLISGHDGLLVLLVFGPLVAWGLIAFSFAGLVDVRQLEFAGRLFDFAVDCQAVERHDGVFGRLGGCFSIWGEFRAEVGLVFVVVASEYLRFHNFYYYYTNLTSRSATRLISYQNNTKSLKSILQTIKSSIFDSYLLSLHNFVFKIIKRSGNQVHPISQNIMKPQIYL